MVCYQLIISGKVQGVFYRDSARRMANSLGICGWVRNELDGNVSMEIEGTDDKVHEMIEWCKRGPTHAHVKEVTFDEINLKGYKSFEIR